MEEEKFIYVVTSGSYSDYSIDKIFSSRKLAEDWIGDFIDSFHIEEHRLDDMDGKQDLAVCWDCNFDIVKKCLISMCAGSEARLLDDPLSVYHDHYRDRWVMSVHLPRKYNQEKCIKTLSDITAQLIALNRISYKTNDVETFDRKTLEPLNDFPQ